MVGSILQRGDGGSLTSRPLQSRYGEPNLTRTDCQNKPDVSHRLDLVGIWSSNPTSDLAENSFAANVDEPSSVNRSDHEVSLTSPGLLGCAQE